MNEKMQAQIKEDINKLKEAVEVITEASCGLAVCDIGVRLSVVKYSEGLSTNTDIVRINRIYRRIPITLEEE